MRIRSLFLLSFLMVSTLALAQSTRKNVIVSPEWLAAHPDVVVLDITNRDSFAKGHIPGARLVDLQSIVTDRDGMPNELPEIATLESVFSAVGVGDRGRIVVYSRDPLFAARAWFTLDYLGQGHRTSYLDGGFARWTAEERPVATEITPVVSTPPSGSTPAAFHASVRTGALTNIKELRSLVKWRTELASDLAMIDARAPEQFCGMESGADVERAGHIPGAVNVSWTENLTAGSTPRLLPERELRDLYMTAGVSPKSTNIVYCRTGMQASLTYMVLKYLGYDAALYDGSFIEWSGEHDTLIVVLANHVTTTPRLGGK